MTRIDGFVTSTPSTFWRDTFKTEEKLFDLQVVVMKKRLAGKVKGYSSLRRLDLIKAIEHTRKFEQWFDDEVFAMRTVKRYLRMQSRVRCMKDLGELSRPRTFETIQS